MNFRKAINEITSRIFGKKAAPIVYKCAECDVSALVIVEGETTTVVRPCKHDKAGVVADMSATAYGIGSAKYQAMQ